MSAVPARAPTSGRAAGRTGLTPRAGRALLSCLALLALCVLVLALVGAGHVAPLPWIGRGVFGAGLLFGVTGAAAAARLTPAPLRSIWPVLALPAGAVLGPLALTVLGFAAVPLHVSLWLVLAVGVVAWFRWGRGQAPAVDWTAAAPWLVMVAVALLLAAIPAWHLSATTIYGQNPDSHQVAGSAVLLQHAPAWDTRPGQPIEVVPSVWRFRYPILYALAGASSLVHFDPIFVFPGLSALLVALAAIGFGAFAVCCLRLPLAAGPWVAMSVPLNAQTLHLAWHPYYNQLWGTALLPFALTLGWWAARERSIPGVAAWAAVMLALGLAYPLAALYPVLLLAGLAWAYGLRRRALPRPRGALQVGAAAVGLALLAVPVFGALVKIGSIVRQLFDLHATLWHGDVFDFLSLDKFVGALFVVVLPVAVIAARRLLTRREAIALGVVFGICVLFDIRLRLSDQGQYMDFKHLSFVGVVVLAFAAAGVASLALSRRRWPVVAAAVLAAVWLVPAIHEIRRGSDDTSVQVTDDMLQLRAWSREIPSDESIRIDVPATGVQLWAQYMLAAHPLSELTPVLHTTYAHAPRGTGGDYALTPLLLPPRVAPRYADPVPVHTNGSFELWRLHVPAGVPDTSSRAMVQP